MNAPLMRPLQEAFAGVWHINQEHKVSLCTASFIVACQRVLHARETRGLYPRSLPSPVAIGPTRDGAAKFVHQAMMLCA